jgi:hypothetical protein
MFQASVRACRPPSRARRRFAPRLEALEDRTLLAAGIQEEYALELINRLRTNPQAELPLLLNSTDPDVQNALSFFHVDRTVLAQQWASLTPVQPLAWNDILAGTAVAHSQLMNQFDEQSHQLPGEPPPDQRLQNAGYAFSSFGENVFASATNIFEDHAAFAIDWGNTSTGIQDPPGHRNNLMNPAFREVGIGVVNVSPGNRNTGPLLITEDLGSQLNPGNPFLVGAVFADADGDGFYSPGEGLAGVSVSVAGPGGPFTTTTSAAGGYQLQLPAGTYTVTFSGGGLASPVVQSVTVAANNVLLNVNNNNDVPTSSVNPLPAVTGSAAFTVSWSGTGSPAIASFDVFVSDNGGPFTAFLTGTTQTSATFSGQDGHTYGFFSVARDTAGRVQPTPAGAQATTLLQMPALPPPTTTTTLPAAGITAQVVPLKVGKKKRLMVEVLFADTGGLKGTFPSPFQKPGFKNIQVSVLDSNGDGVPDLVVLTARKGKRTVTVAFPG